MGRDRPRRTRRRAGLGDGTRHRCRTVRRRRPPWRRGDRSVAPDESPRHSPPTGAEKRRRGVIDLDDLLSDHDRGARERHRVRRQRALAVSARAGRRGAGPQPAPAPPGRSVPRRSRRPVPRRRPGTGDLRVQRVRSGAAAATSPIVSRASRSFDCRSTIAARRRSSRRRPRAAHRRPDDRRSCRLAPTAERSSSWRTTTSTPRRVGRSAHRTARSDTRAVRSGRGAGAHPRRAGGDAGGARPTLGVADPADGRRTGLAVHADPGRGLPDQ